MTDSSFPSTGFILDALALHLEEAGFESVDEPAADLELIAAEGDLCWIIEAIRQPCVNTDSFYRALGRLVTHIDDRPWANYVLALPAIDKLEWQCRELDVKVRGSLNLWLGLVAKDRSVYLMSPTRVPATSTHDNGGYVNSTEESPEGR